MSLRSDVKGPAGIAAIARLVKPRRLSGLAEFTDAVLQSAVERDFEALCERHGNVVQLSVADMWKSASAIWVHTCLEPTQLALGCRQNRNVLCWCR